MRSYLKQQTTVTVFNRQLSDKLVIKALSVMILYLFIAFTSIMIITKLNKGRY